MSTIFLTEQGSRLIRQGHALSLVKDNEKLFVFPIENVSQIVILGRIEISTALMGTLLSKGIDTIFLSRSGRLKGRLVGDISKNIEVRELQFLKSQQKKAVLDFSKHIVQAKAQNALRMLQKRRSVPLDTFKSRLRNFKNTVDSVRSLDVLRGIEGNFSKIYFKIFPQLLTDDFGFAGRKKHPPTDPLNVLLSFGYTLLFQNIYAQVYAAGLDPYKGFYHQTHYGHPALVSDLIEQFRAPFVDSLIITLINRQQIRASHFEKDSKGVRFKKEGIKIFIEMYQKKLESRLLYNNLQLTYLQIIRAQVYHLVDCLKNDKPYKPFIYE